jgi:hypothetical protein
MNTSFADEAQTAAVNGLWYNTRVRPGVVYGPVSGDSMTAMRNYSEPAEFEGAPSLTID